MCKVQVWAELTGEHYHAYELEAKRRGVSVEELVEKTVNCLLKELEREETECLGADEFLSVS
jgi:hypothetical protein